MVNDNTKVFLSDDKTHILYKREGNLLKPVVNSYSESDLLKRIIFYVTDDFNEFEVKKCNCGFYHKLDLLHLCSNKGG